MASLAQTVRWDLGLQVRSFIYPATVVSTGMICGFILLLPVSPLPVAWSTFFIFIDPALLGLSFIGAIVLMEKTEGTIFALGVTPMRPSIYVASKTISLTLLAFASGLVVAFVAAEDFNLLTMLLALTLSSTVAVLIGFVCVARIPSMNKLMITLLWVTVLGYIPLLSHFELIPGVLTPVIALIPSYAILLAVKFSIAPTELSMIEMLYAYGYLVLWCVIGWLWTLREYTRYIITDGK